MSDLSDLYQEVILDHNKRPRNFHVARERRATRRRASTRCAAIACTCICKVEDDVVTEVGFQGSGCAISKASASMMTDSVKGRPVAEVQDLFRRFHTMVTTPPDQSVEDMGKLSALAGVREFPVRVKCASLAWHTLKAALERDPIASTE